jgi:hypothetical protein
MSESSLDIVADDSHEGRPETTQKCGHYCPCRSNYPGELKATEG